MENGWTWFGHFFPLLARKVRLREAEVEEGGGGKKGGVNISPTFTAALTAMSPPPPPPHLGSSTHMVTPQDGGGRRVFTLFSFCNASLLPCVRLNQREKNVQPKKLTGSFVCVLFFHFAVSRNKRLSSIEPANDLCC